MEHHCPRRPAFGQFAAIGTLYDARNERFLPGSLFDKESQLEITSVDKTTCKVVPNDLYADNMKWMGVGNDFGASIIAGLTVLDGAGLILDEKAHSRYVWSAAIHYQVLTVREKLVPISPGGVNQCRPTTLAESRNATHIVLEIEWGSQSAVMARSSTGANKLLFQDQVQAFQKCVENKLPIIPGNAAWIQDTDTAVEIMAFSDILNDGILMSEFQNFQETAEFLSLIPAHIKHENGGKGRPVFYTLLPIPLLNVILRTEAIDGAIYKQPSQELLTDFIKTLDLFDHHRRKCNDYQAFVVAHRWCISRAQLHSVITHKQKLDDARLELQTNYAKCLVAVCTGTLDLEQLRALRNEFAQGSSSLLELAKFDKSQQAKVQFIDKMVESGATYIGYNGIDPQSEISKHDDGEVYVLFFSSQAKGDQQSWIANQALLLELLQRPQPNCFIAILDCDAIDIKLEKAHIKHFVKGKEVATDLVEERHFLADKSFARYSKVGLETKDILKPVRRRFVKIACPGNSCDKNEVCEWLCPECMAPVEFGYSDPFFYCDCGRNRFSSYDFKCKGANHGPQYAKYDSTVLKVILDSLDQSNYQNILILGETGVGKSTFINAFVNYLTFDTLEDAKQHEDLTWVIPCSFSTQTMDREGPEGEIVETEIKVGSRTDENDGSKGASATQRTIVHSVEAGTATIRLIDTPGIGDTRGIGYDRKNMADILQTLSNYDELHGILILLKSNSARLTTSFIYCLKELLKHLHRSASKNMVFGFTNTRISNYTPGDTFGPLKSLLAENPEVGFALTTNTTYCFDSESFRYLAAYKNKVFLPNEEDFRRSWQHSRMEALRLVKNFNSKPPHAVNSTLSLNGARELISELTKPMAEISQTIRANIALCADKETELGNTRLSGNNLRKRVQLQRIQLNPKTLDKPRTVCTHGSCVEYKDDGNGTGTVVTNYYSHCHPVCYLPDVRPDSVAHAGLRNCAAFTNEVCDKSSCRHRWELHQHVIYELVETVATVTDSEIEKQLNANANDVTLRLTAIAELKQRGIEYGQEHKQIQQAAAQFGMFLKQNSISPINDATIAYIDSLIDAEKNKIKVGGNNIKLRALQADRAEYLETIKILTLNMSNNGNLKPLDEAGVTKVVQELYSLKHFGKSLLNVKNVTAKAHQATYRERPHRLPRNQNNMKDLLRNNWPKLPTHQPETTVYNAVPRLIQTVAYAGSAKGVRKWFT